MITSTPPHSRRVDQFASIESKMIQSNGQEWLINRIKDKTVKQEAGSAKQIKAILINSDKKDCSLNTALVSSDLHLEFSAKREPRFSSVMNLPVRVKRISSFNEAIVYQKILNEQDSLSPFVPRCLGVLDERGVQIDMESELRIHSPQLLIEKYKNCYIILADLTTELNGDEVFEVSDFKFAKSTLISNDEEVLRHGQRQHNIIFKIFRSIFFKFSRFSFVFQRSVSNKFLDLINRIRCIFNTKNQLTQIFASLNQDELNISLTKLKSLKLAIKKSNFVFADCSVLIVPIKKNGITSSLNFHLIDLSHGISRDENIKGYDQMKQDMKSSIQDIISLIHRRLKNV